MEFAIGGVFMSASLYHKQIVTMARRCNEHPTLEHPDASTYVDNPLCGDNIEIGVELKDDKLVRVGFKVRGCLLCEAGATWIAERLVGLSTDVPSSLESDIRALLKRENETVVDDWEALDVFLPVQSAKSRHRCVLLPFEALNKALAQLAADSENDP